MTTTSNLPNPPADQFLESCRVIVFTISGHFLTLPIATVVKVISSSQILNFSATESGLIYLDDQPITCLNLESCFKKFNKNSDQVSVRNSGQFLLIVSHQNHLYSIAVDEPPILMDLPLATVKILPTNYRESIQNIAYHVAVLSDQEQSKTLLLIDLEQSMKISKPL
jgi:chemotaxis signal transduction protein